MDSSSFFSSLPPRAQCPMCPFEEEFFIIDNMKLFYCRTCNVVVWLDVDSECVVHIMEPEIPLAKDYKLFTQDGLFWVESKSLQSVSFIEARSGKEVLYHSGTRWKRSSTNCPQMAMTAHYRDLDVTVTAGHIVLNYSCGQNLFSKLFDRKTATEVLIEGHSSYNHLCLLYTSPSPRDLSTSRMPSSA